MLVNKNLSSASSIEMLSSEGRPSGIHAVTKVGPLQIWGERVHASGVVVVD